MTGWVQGWLIPALLRRRIFGGALVASLLAVCYWGVIASDRYVSEARVIIQRTDFAGGQGVDFGGLLGGMGGNHADQLLLRDHLLSVDMFEKLDAKLNLRAHYSDWHRDPLSRMWFKDAPLEEFHRHYLSRVSVEYDDYAGVLIVKAQAYDPQTAKDIATTMVEEGERHMNAMVHELAQDQVAFLEKQVGDMGARTIQARQAVLNFQNKKGMVSPQGTAENIVSIINRLEAQLTDLQTRRAVLLGYLMPGSPNVVELNQQIAAVEKQIAQEQGRLVSPAGSMLNSTVEEFQRLQMNAEFAQDIYRTALVALEKGRIEASRTLKKVTMLQAPTLPQYPLEPRRIYNAIVFILVTLLLAGIMHLLAAIIRDHKD
ncbi:MAG: chain-length determining protein [Nitrosomonadales bacterium]|nr:chain-length determining protein [Nitrosomonadales bacterium]